MSCLMKTNMNTLLHSVKSAFCEGLDQQFYLSLIPIPSYMVAQRGPATVPIGRDQNCIIENNRKCQIKQLLIIFSGANQPKMKLMQ